MQRATCNGLLLLLATGCGEPTDFIPADPSLIATVPVPPNYGLHDTYVRDGLAFLSAWNTGVIILDVGHGVAGGSPEAPVEVTRFALDDAGRTVQGAVHNTWWFHNPTTGEQRYLFIGQEGPGTLGALSSGDLYVYDVSTLTAPQFVGAYTLPGAGAHNVWMDEVAETLFAAYYNGGVIALDVSGTLPADLSTRELDRIQPGGDGNTHVWGVMQGPDGRVWATDMVSGFWRLSFEGSAFAVTGGGNNAFERFSSDLWVHGNTGYSGTWGFRSEPGDAVLIWDLAGPTRIRTMLVDSVTTISDVEVSTDGRLLLLTTENGPHEGFVLYDLANDPRAPRFLLRQGVESGLHTGTLVEREGRTYVFGAKNPGFAPPALMIWDVTESRP